MKRVSLISLLLGAATLSTATIAASVTYYKDVLPILQNHCQTCHRPGQLAPVSFLTYKETRPWAESIKYLVAAKRMPPWFAETPYSPVVARHPALTVREIETIVRWVDEGAVAGDPKDAPPPTYEQEGRRRVDQRQPFSAARREIPPFH
ncbi:MAG: cytochrome c [Acidobacteriia bacterium]|nr:cytochrome c [Terriglobia bacterium]